MGVITHSALYGLKKVRIQVIKRILFAVCPNSLKLTTIQRPKNFV